MFSDVLSGWQKCLDGGRWDLAFPYGESSVPAVFVQNETLSA